MLKIALINASAETRNRLFQRITQLVSVDLPTSELLPHLSLKPLCLEEIKFHATPDLCIVGEDLITQDLVAIAQIKRALPECPVLVELRDALSTLSTVEQLARLGGDDTFAENINPVQFLRKVVLLAKKVRKRPTGKLILVDGAKGGVGGTSVTAALGEALLEQGLRVALMDLDSETQALSRFLQARPFVNENLELIIGQQRALTREFVEQCWVPVWHDEPNLVCVPPVSDADGLFDPRAVGIRTFISVIEILDSEFDCLVIDSGTTRGTLLKALYRAADRIIYVINGDPATLYPSVERISRLRENLSPQAELLIVENDTTPGNLPHRLLKAEFCRAAQLESNNWFDQPIPYCRQGGRWPGSTSTLFSLGRPRVRRAFKELGERLGFASVTSAELTRRHKESSPKVPHLALEMLGQKSKDSAVNGAVTPVAAPTNLPPALPEPIQITEEDMSHLVSRAAIAS